MVAHELDEEAIFNVARKIDSADAREAYLRQVCEGNQSLRNRVDALLKVHEQEKSFLASPASPPVATIDEPEITERPGSVIGPYKLLQQIGEGGMGTVFMAEQTHPVQRKVAVKVIKPGMDSRQVIARFEAERQALATPKSITFTTGLLSCSVTITFEGLMSRWMIPLWWACCTAWQTSANSSRRSRGVSWFWSQKSVMGTPLTSSMTK